jgi:hypothetical protein
MGLGERDPRRHRDRRRRGAGRALGPGTHRGWSLAYPREVARPRRPGRAAGSHRIHPRPGRRPAAGRRSPGGADPSQRLPRRAPALGSGEGQDGCRGQLQARRLPAHRRTHPAPPGADRAGHPGTPGPHPHPRRPGGGEGRRGQPARRPPRRALARRQGRVRGPRLRHRPGVPGALPRRGWRRSANATPTAADARPPT